MTQKRSRETIQWLNHTVNFISVLLGIVIAFSLQNWNENRKERKTIHTALNNIANEIRTNLGRIDTVIQKNQAQLNMQYEYLDLIDENFGLKVGPEEWETFALKYPDYFNPEEQSWTLDFDLFILSRVAWETTQQMGILSSLDFELAADIGTVYEIQEKVEQFDMEMVDKVSQLSTQNSESLIRLLRSVRSRIAFALSLRDSVYPEMLEGLEANIERYD